MKQGLWYSRQKKDVSIISFFFGQVFALFPPQNLIFISALSQINLLVFISSLPLCFSTISTWYSTVVTTYSTQPFKPVFYYLFRDYIYDSITLLGLGFPLTLVLVRNWVCFGFGFILEYALDISN